MTFEKIFGAFPSSAREYNILVETYIPAFPQDRTEVRITAFMMEAATASPALWNTRVNGLTARFSIPVFVRFASVYGSRKPTTITAPM